MKLIFSLLCIAALFKLPITSAQDPPIGKSYEEVTSMLKEYYVIEDTAPYQGIYTTNEMVTKIFFFEDSLCYQIVVIWSTMDMETVASMMDSYYNYNDSLGYWETDKFTVDLFYTEDYPGLHQQFVYK